MSIYNLHQNKKMSSLELLKYKTKPQEQKRENTSIDNLFEKLSFLDEWEKKQHIKQKVEWVLQNIFWEQEFTIGHDFLNESEGNEEILNLFLTWVYIESKKEMTNKEAYQHMENVQDTIDKIEKELKSFHNSQEIAPIIQWKQENEIFTVKTRQLDIKWIEKAKKDPKMKHNENINKRLNNSHKQFIGLNMKISAVKKLI